MKFSLKITFLFLLLLSCMAANCTPAGDAELEKIYKVGGLYSITAGDTEFNVAKVIAITKGMIHIRQYGNRFETRPESVDPSKLFLDDPNNPADFGLRHLPVDKETFEKMQPVFIKQENVSEEELEGFKAWKDAVGGFFN